MLVLLLLLGLFIQIDAVGEQVNPFNAFVATDDPTDAEIARSQVLESLRAMVANRDQNPGVDIYGPVVNRLLDIFVNAANRDQENQVADLVVQAYNRFNQELERRGVQMPPLNQLGRAPRIDAPTFRNVGLGPNGQPFSSLDAFILQVFNPEITTQRAINLQPLNDEANRSNSPYRSPIIKYQSSTPLQANEEFQGEGLPGAGAALVTPENISGAARRLFESPPLVGEVQEEVGQSPQGFSTPPTNAGHPETVRQAGLARGRVRIRRREEEPAQDRNVRPRLNRDTTPTNRLYWAPPRRDDENEDGGGVPVE